MPSPGLRGMIAAVQVYNQLAARQQQEQEMAMQREAMAMQKQDRETAKADRERRLQIEDIRNIEFLAQHGRPLSPGNLLEQQGEAALPQIPGQPSSVPFSFTRAANPDRVREYKASDGAKFSVELYTPKEREQMALQQFQEQESLRQQIAAAGAAMKRQTDVVGMAPEAFNQFGVNPGTPMTAQELGTLGGILQRGQAATQQQAGRMADRETRVTIAENNAKGANERAAQANATRLKAAGISAAGADRRANTAVERIQQQRAAKLQEEHDSLQQKEQAAWAEYRSASAAMGAAQKEIADNKLKAGSTGYGAVSAREASARQKAEKAKGMAEALLAQKVQVLKRKDALMGQDEAGKVKQPAASAQGEIRYKDGVPYRFDAARKAWVEVN